MSDIDRPAGNAGIVPTASNARYPSSADASTTGGSNTTANSWVTLHTLTIDATDVPYAKVSHSMDYDGTNAFSSGEYAHGRVRCAETDSTAAKMSSLGTDLPKTTTGYIDLTAVEGDVLIDLQYYTDSGGGVQCTGGDVYRPQTVDVLQQATAHITVDSFEDGDIAEYTGDTAEFSTETTGTTEGKYRLASSNVAGSGIYSASGLNAYPSAGDKFEFDVQYTGSSSGSLNGTIYFGTQAESNSDGYSVVLTPGKIELRVRSSGSYTTLDSATISSSSSTWYTYSVAWGSDGTITAELLDGSGNVVGTVSATDTTYTSGGIGWRVGGPDLSSFKFDRFTITG